MASSEFMEIDRDAIGISESHVLRLRFFDHSQQPRFELQWIAGSIVVGQDGHGPSDGRIAVDLRHGHRVFFSLEFGALADGL